MLSTKIKNMPVGSSKKAEQYYEALLNRDSNYVGIFYACVRTTLVFCIATCRARKPKFENVFFCSTFKEALEQGYRPCKICKPTENSGETPVPVKSAINLVKENPGEKISDEKLRSLKISPELVRRWFKRQYGITFQAYQRMYRINNAFKDLKDGKKTSATAYDLGYESLSGFGYTFKKLIGKSPTQSSEQIRILINRLTTPLGPMFICASDQGILLLEFTDLKTIDSEFRDLQKRLKAEILIGENKFILQAKKELNEYFTGRRKTFDVQLDSQGTAFQLSVWKVLLQVPFGTTTSYGEQALRLKKPRAVRAVASANGANKIAIIIPCHRIIGKGGSLTGYAGGIERKKWLIEFEKNRNGSKS